MMRPTSGSKKKLLGHGTLTCPECGHRWPVAADQLSDYAHVQETVRPAITRREIAESRVLIGNRVRIAAIRSELEQLEIPADRSAELARLRAHAAAVEAHQHARDAWAVYNRDLPGKQARLSDLTDVPGLLIASEQALTTARDADWWRRVAPLETEMVSLAGAECSAHKLEAALNTSLDHERLLADFRNTRAAFDRVNSEIEEIEARAAECATARERITALKLSLKSHLLPSLNRVASSLLAQMTGGTRSRIEIDDAFEILVDGQALATLSGSGHQPGLLALHGRRGRCRHGRGSGRVHGSGPPPPDWSRRSSW
ncbi:hypothetical protein [Pararhodobacter sp. SW119]|uniref:hypothetical protein n=1 Tax=Pararhodobacter sp. SW119 TaxID=2780075 RepID=UPI001ADFC250|nr:hypothetical protein [Pararhodobacter sp. SW119]